MKKLVCIIITFVLFFSLSLSVSASETVEVKGLIHNTETEYDVTYDPTVKWFVTEASHADIWNNLDGENANCYKIINNTNGSEIQVSLVSFTCDSIATGIAEDLDLHLTGSLGADHMEEINLANGYTDSITYTKTLESGEEKAWAYGFSGEYKEHLSTTAINPVYYMELSFEFL